MSTGATAHDICDVAKLVRGLGDPTRHAIVTLLANEERRISEIVDALGGSQGNMSGHLNCLREYGRVTDWRSGRKAFTRVARHEVIAILRSAESLLAITGRISTCAPTANGWTYDR